MQRWFFSSDRDHMPWHTKNILVNVLFDQGLFGLALFLLLITVALWRLSLGKARQHELAPCLCAAIVGFLVVGMFDSLIDVPRLSLLFHVLIFLSFSLNAVPESYGKPVRAV
jgi:O-antigen ligase